jgi:hypothetical protein
LHAQLKAEAERQDRSLNSLIIHMLRRTMRRIEDRRAAGEVAMSALD